MLIDKALRLDFDARTEFGFRPARDNSPHPIEISTRKHPSAHMRMTVIHTAVIMGYHNECDVWKKKEIAKAAISMVAYDNGLARAPKGTMFNTWMDEMTMAVKKERIDLNQVLVSKNKGNDVVKQTEDVEEKAPGFLHQCYRGAIKEEGVEASFVVLAETMNSISQTIEDKPNLTLSKSTLYEWFKNNNGKCVKRTKMIE